MTTGIGHRTIDGSLRPFFIRQEMMCNATFQILLVSAYVKGNLILSSTKKN